VRRLVWLEFNIHVTNVLVSMQNLYDDVTTILLDLVKPFIDEQRSRFAHWHYLHEPDVCRGRGFCELRLRFEGESANLEEIKNTLIRNLKEFSDKTSLAMSDDEPLGSHEGCHGSRNATYMGAQSEKFGGDWPTIVEIMQKGSEFALEFFRLGRNLVENRSLQYGRRDRPSEHPYYVHLPANEILVEP